MALLVGIDLDVPRNLQVILAAALLSSPFGWYAGKRVSSLLHSPNWVYIVELDTRKEESGLYRVPSDGYTQFTVTKGEVDRPNPHLVFAQNVDLEAKTLEGVWRGTLSDRELMAELSNVYEIRGQLQQDAQEGFAVKSQAWMIVRDATRRATKSIVRTFERGTMPSEDGLEVSEAVENAVDSFDFGLVEDSQEPDFDPFEAATEEMEIEPLEAPDLENRPKRSGSE